MKTISSIKLANQSENFVFTKLIIKGSILLVVGFVLLDVLGIPIL